MKKALLVTILLSANLALILKVFSYNRKVGQKITPMGIISIIINIIITTLVTYVILTDIN